MKARVIHTKFWTDSYIGTLSVAEKLLFIYLFTNELVNIINLYEISERKIIFDTGLTPDQFNKAIHKFTTDNKIGYRYGYVYLYNGFKYQNYVGEKNEEAKNKLLQALSEDLRTWYYTPMYTPINTPLIGTSNKKSLINNKKLEINNTIPLHARDVLDKFNEVMRTNYTSTKAIEDNLKYWLDSYTLDEIKQAIENIRRDDFWRDKMKPETLFRRKNPQGEKVDYIGTLLNNKKRLPVAPVSIIEEERKQAVNHEIVNPEVIEKIRSQFKIKSITEV